MAMPGDNISASPEPRSLREDQGGDMKANTDHLVAELNRAFGPPFLPAGFFRAGPRAKGFGKGLKLKIGDRDLEIDGKGKLCASGSNVGKGVVWEIKKT